MSLWVKELIKKLFLRTFFIFNLIVLLYILVDFSINTFKLLNPPFTELSKYYFCQISNYLDLFLPIAFLIAMLKILTEMNTNKELIALFSSGLSKNIFLLPIYLIASALSIISFFNHEIIIPKVAYFMEEFQVKYFSKKNKNNLKKVNNIAFDDHSQIVFSKYDLDKQTLEDVFWIKNFNEIWHIKNLELKKPVVGHFVDQFIRNRDNKLIKASSHISIEILDLSISKNLINKALVPLSKKELTKLIFTPKEKFIINNHEKNALVSVKLISIFSFLMIVFCIGPYCLNFSRLFSPNLIFSISIISFIFFYIMKKTLFSLCINQVMSCFFALWFPCLLLTSVGFYGYFKNNK